MFNILAIDISGVAHNIWHTIEPSTPILEKRTFKTQFFRALYQAILETSPENIFFVMDSRGGYWRHPVYQKWYQDKVLVATDESGMLWMQHDGRFYAIMQTGAGIFTKQSRKKGDLPETWQLPWVDVASLRRAMDATSNTEVDVPAWTVYLAQISEYFPKYKGHRNKSKWPHMTGKSEWQDALGEVTREAAKALGAAVVQVQDSEADDIMSHLAATKKKDLTLCIMSEDSDMDQLQVHGNVVRYKPSSKEFVEVEDPLYGIKMKVILGDGGDGIKSVKRMEPRKQTKADPRTAILKPIGVNGAEELLANGNVAKVAEEQGWLDHLNFNTTMIFLGRTPEELKKQIKKEVMLAINGACKEGRTDSFGIPMEELRLMRAVAVTKKLRFSGAGTAETGDFDD